MLPTQLLSLGTKPRCACVRGTRPFDSAQGRLFAECAKDGAPTAFSVSAKLEAGPPRLFPLIPGSSDGAESCH